MTALFGKKKTENTSEKKDVKKDAPVKAVTVASPGKAKKGGTADLYKDQKPKKAKKGENKTGLKSGNAYRVLVKPLITEKAANLAAESKYAFAVNPNSNKIEIKKAVEEVYGVKVEKVNVTHVSGKKVRQGRFYGRRKDWKKAIVTLPKGQTIKIYEGV